MPNLIIAVRHCAAEGGAATATALAAASLRLTHSSPSRTGIRPQGPPGIGKTTSILCLAKALLGPAYKNAVQETNASDERCVAAKPVLVPDVVRCSLLWARRSSNS